MARIRLDGFITRGGDLDPTRLLVAYANGIFPWPHEGISDILWFCPSPRPVLIPGAIHVGRSTVRAVRKRNFEISFDTAFSEVIHSCAGMRRRHERGTWITEDIISAYLKLFDLGFAHSVEAWHGDRLVGGVYGVTLGAAFFGESMFRIESDASKIALIALLEQLEEWNFKFLDCQMRTPIANQLGAVDWDGDYFQKVLEGALATPTRQSKWRVTRQVFELKRTR